MSKPKAKNPQFIDPVGAPVFTLRFAVALLLIALGIAWIVYYYLAVRVDPAALDAKPGKPGFMADWKNWNYAVGFGAILLGLLVSAHPSTPLGRNRGVVIGMLGCFLLGLAWIVTFYVVSNNISPIPVMNDLGNHNLVVGIGFMAVGFAFATRWE